MIKIESKVKRNQGRDQNRTFNLLSDMDLDFDNLFYYFVPYWQVLWDLTIKSQTPPLLFV